MFSFFLGLATGVVVLLNGPSVRRGIARAALTGGDAAATAGREARKLSAKLIEDFQDAFAEVKQERAVAEAQQQGAAQLLAELRELRAAIASIESQRGGTVH
jgi:hypothetical protein